MRAVEDICNDIRHVLGRGNTTVVERYTTRGHVASCPETNELQGLFKRLKEYAGLVYEYAAF